MSLSSFLRMKLGEVEHLGGVSKAQSSEDTRVQQENRRRLGMECAHWEVKQY